MYQKATPPLQKRPNKNPYVNNSEPPVSRLCCTALALAFPFSLINATTCVLTLLSCESIHLSHWPILWLVKARTLDTGLPQKQDRREKGFFSRKMP
jgi:hypothetical protein